MVAEINTIMSSVSNVEAQISGGSTSSTSTESTATKTNQQKYLENLSSTGTSGQKKWAESQLKMKKYHDGIENGLVGGLPMPKSWEQVALLAKGEPVFNQPQMNNIASFVNSAIPKMQDTAKSVGDIIINGMSVTTPNAQDFAKQLQRVRITNS
jgi:hypothetical protein